MHFLGHGWEVFWPVTGSSPCDLVAVRGPEVMRLQVKTASWHTKGGSRYLRTKIQTMRKYKVGDFDYLAAVDNLGRIWNIPQKELPDTSYIYLRRTNKKQDIKTYGWDKWLLID
jgi:hypothetical protein